MAALQRGDVCGTQFHPENSGFTSAFWVHCSAVKAVCATGQYQSPALRTGWLQSQSMGAPL